MKNLVLISYIQSLFNNFLVKAEFSTNDEDKRVIVVQEQPGQKVVFFGDIDPLFNYYEIVIYGLSIQEMKNTATSISALKGKHIIHEYQNGDTNEKWQIIFKGFCP